MILWQDIKSQVELDIVAGVYHQVNKPNKLPSISEMAQKYNCGKSTAQKVLEELCKDDIVLRKKGIGYFIKPFARQELYEKRVGIYENEAVKLIEEMKNLNIKKDVLMKIITATVDKIYG